jgi:hypothetical protein
MPTPNHFPGLNRFYLDISCRNIGRCLFFLRKQKYGYLSFLGVNLTSQEIYAQSGVGIEFSQSMLFIDVFKGSVRGRFGMVVSICSQFGS